MEERPECRGNGGYILSNSPGFDPARVFQDQRRQEMKRAQPEGVSLPVSLPGLHIWKVLDRVDVQLASTFGKDQACVSGGSCLWFGESYGGERSGDIADEIAHFGCSRLH